MGKKPTLSALEKKLKREAEKQKTAQQKTTSLIEKGPRDVIPPSREELNKFISSSKVVTPFMLAEKFNIKLSIAKQILKDLVNEGILSIVGGDNRVRIYTFTSKTSLSKKETHQGKKA